MRRWVLMVIAANLVGIIALAFIYPQFMVSPGALVPAHAELTGNCFACHAPLRGASSERCVTCHAVKDIGLRTTKGLPLTQPAVKNPFHQELISQDCVACHSDHQGPKLTGQSRKPFSHALLRPTSRDRCESCHVAPKTGVHTVATQQLPAMPPAGTAGSLRHSIMPSSSCSTKITIRRAPPVISTTTTRNTPATAATSTLPTM